jgi:hypothetical protein
VKVGDLVRINVNSRDADYLRAVYNSIMDDVGLIVDTRQKDRSCLVLWSAPPEVIEGFRLPSEDGMLWVRSEHMSRAPGGDV